MSSTTMPHKQRPLSTKVHIVKAVVFPVVTFGYEGWTIEKARP